MSGDMLWPLLVCAIGFTLTFGAIVVARTRAAVMERRIRGLLLAQAERGSGQGSVYVSGQVPGYVPERDAGRGPGHAPDGAFGPAAGDVPGHGIGHVPGHA